MTPQFSGVIFFSLTHAPLLSVSSYFFPFLFHFISFSFLFQFLISPFFFSYLFLLSISFSHFPSFLFWITLTRRDQVGETSPHLHSCHLSTPCLFSYFPLLFFILFIASCNTWLNVSHVFHLHHMDFAMCHSIGVPHGII